MDLTLNDLKNRVTKADKKAKARLKENYSLSRRLGFSSAESVILQSQKREVIINLAIEKGLIKDANDSKAV